MRFQKVVTICKKLLNAVRLLRRPYYVFYRLGSRIKIEQTIADHDFVNHFLIKEALIIKEDLLRHFRERKYVKTFPFNEMDISDNESEPLLRRADEVLSHKFTILGKAYQFQKEIDWSSDFTGKSWIKGHYMDLNSKLYKNDHKNEHYIGDIKIPWEFNKHAHFVTLGQAYAITRDERYAEEFVRQILDWIDKNPYEFNVAWTQNLIVAQRAISWSLALNLFLNSPKLTPISFIKILKSLMQHAYYIENHLELASLASNHLMGNLSALFIVSVFYPEFKRSNKWRKMSLGLLSEEIIRQVYSDGVDFEQSINYHRYVIDFSLIPATWAYLNDKKLPKRFMKRLEKMLEFTMHMTQPNGLVQPISDADGARVWNFSNADINDHRPSLAIGALIFKRGDFKYIAEDKSEDVKWLFGNTGFQGYKSIKSYLPHGTSKAFRKGGYYIMRTGWGKDDSWLFFDCGYVGMGRHNKNMPFASHGHDDILNFGLYAKGRVLITDRGSYTYTASKEWHDYFRSSKAHNLLIIDDENESIHTKTWTLKSIAIPKFIRWHESDGYGYVSGSHDGYGRLKSPVSVIRSVLFLKKKNQIVIKDILTGRDRHKASLYFQLHPGIKPEEESPRRYSLGDDITITSYLEDGVDEILDSWYSPDYGIKVPSKAIRFESYLNIPHKIYTVIDLGPNEPLSRQGVEKLIEGYEESVLFR
ncbi:alginate lyase family protein [Candidatus Omnitrophota bacterium]